MIGKPPSFARLELPRSDFGAVLKVAFKRGPIPTAEQATSKTELSVAGGLAITATLISSESTTATLVVPPPTSDRLAFLHVQGGHEAGFMGGLLVVNGLGRPLEFHCTAPFLPTPTQRILYGKTLDSFVFCEQVGTALIQQLKHRPRAILVQQAKLLELAESSPLPWVWMPEEAGVELQPLSTALQNQRQFTWNQRNVIVTGNATLLDDVSAYCVKFAERLPLDEPFERIRQALDLALEQAR